MQLINYNYDKGAKTLTITLEGDFDFLVHKGFRESYTTVDNKPNKVIVDLRKTKYMDSSALGMLLILKEVFPDAFIQIINTNDFVKELLSISNFDKIFNI